MNIELAINARAALRPEIGLAERRKDLLLVLVLLDAHPHLGRALVARGDQASIKPRPSLDQASIKPRPKKRPNPDQTRLNTGGRFLSVLPSNLKDWAR